MTTSFLEKPVNISLPLVRVWLHLECENHQKLPRYLFSPLRSVVGAQLKRISCVARRYEECIACPLNQHCAYGYIFETPRPPEAHKLRLYPYLPHPFVMTPPFPVPGNNHLKLGLTLIGRAVQYFPHFVLALEAAGRSGIGKNRVKFKITSVTDNYSGNILYQDGRLSPPQIKSDFSDDLDNKFPNITIIFKTPTYLRFQEKFVTPETLEFHIIIRNLLRRISSLSYFHCNQELNIDFKNIISKSEKVRVMERELEIIRFSRFSKRKKRSMPLKGLLGKIRIEGNIVPFLNILRVGELVHVGKNTSFGFGHYQILIN